MSKRKYTAGPWEVRDSFLIEDGVKRFVEIFEKCDEEGINVLADVYQNNEGTMFSNANLIASAPDLLNAVEHVLAISEDGGMNDIDFDMLREAVSKAKGLC